MKNRHRLILLSAEQPNRRRSHRQDGALSSWIRGSEVRGRGARYAIRRSLPDRWKSTRSLIRRTPYVDWDGLINPLSWIRPRRSKNERRPRAPMPPARSEPARRSLEGPPGCPLSRDPALSRISASAGPSISCRPCVDLCREFEPDIILVSGPPFSSFVGVAYVARRLGIPWCAEFRDRWMDDPYHEWPPWRRRFDQWFERLVLRGAVGIVTVTEVWAEFYAGKYRKPIVNAMNGFDPKDFDHVRHVPPPTSPLSIVHMGSVYANRTRSERAIPGIAARGLFAERRSRSHSTDGSWTICGRKSPSSTLAASSSRMIPFHTMRRCRFNGDADVLLLIQWNDEKDNGNIPGKFFEYAASRRPILGMGPEGGIPAAMIDRHKLGLYSNDPDKICQQIAGMVRS